MNETSKAAERRTEEFVNGYFDWEEVLRGKAIDIGCGPDPLKPGDWRIDSVTPFDQEQGDANRTDEYFEPGSFDLVHASQALEHMHNPFDAFKRWLKLVAVDGHAVISVPDFDLYEKCTMPSLFNPDHKSTWSLWRQENLGVYRHVYVPRLLSSQHYFPSPLENWEVIRLALVDTNYNYMLPASVDQTLGNAEAFIEFVVRRVK